MPEECTTHDLVERVRQAYEAVRRRDFDSAVSFYAPNGMWDMREMGVFEGRAAIRGFLDDWFAAYEDYQIEVEEILDLGNGDVFAVLVQKGGPMGSRSEVRVRHAQTFVGAQGAIARATNGTDIAKDRAAAERLAESRG